MRADGSACGGAGGCGCDTCGEANSSVGAQALAWAMQVQSPAARADRFWGPLAVADAPLRASIHDAASADIGLAVMESLRTHVDLHAGAPWRRGDGAAFDVDLPIQMSDSPPQAPPGGPAGQPVTETPYTATKEEWERILHPSQDMDPDGTLYVPRIKGAKCCPKTFEYPKTIEPVTGTEVRIEKFQLRQIQRKFRIEAEFWPSSPDKPTCDCNCCTFRQLVFLNDPNSKRSDKPDWPERHGSGSPGGEDTCEWIIMSKNDKPPPERLAKVVSGPRSSPPDAGEGQLYGPYCYGDHSPPAWPPDLPDPPAPEYTPSDPNDPGTAGCKFKTEDSPSVGVDYPGTFNWKWESWGVIYDRCNGYPPLEVRRLTWEVEGSTDASGTVAVKTKSPDHKSGAVKGP